MNKHFGDIKKRYLFSVRFRPAYAGDTCLQSPIYGGLASSLPKDHAPDEFGYLPLELVVYPADGALSRRDLAFQMAHGRLHGVKGAARRGRVVGRRGQLRHLHLDRAQGVHQRGGLHVDLRLQVRVQHRPRVHERLGLGF